MANSTARMKAPTTGSWTVKSTAGMIGPDDELFDGEVDGSGERANDGLSDGQL